jgi:hypothetical protein
MPCREMIFRDSYRNVYLFAIEHHSNSRFCRSWIPKTADIMDSPTHTDIEKSGMKTAALEHQHHEHHDSRLADDAPPVAEDMTWRTWVAIFVTIPYPYSLCTKSDPVASRLFLHLSVSRFGQYLQRVLCLLLSQPNSEIPHLVLGSSPLSQQVSLIE